MSAFELVYWWLFRAAVPVLIAWFWLVALVIDYRELCSLTTLPLPTNVLRGSTCCLAITSRPTLFPNCWHWHTFRWIWCGLLQLQRHSQAIGYWIDPDPDPDSDCPRYIPHPPCTTSIPILWANHNFARITLGIVYIWYITYYTPTGDHLIRCETSGHRAGDPACKLQSKRAGNS